MTNDGIENQYRIDSKSQILSRLKVCADIVTTEVKVHKIMIYDTSKSEHFSWIDPNTWKIGDRVCIIPVDVTLKYGYDLHELKIEDIKIENDSSQIGFFLPKPKIIDAGYDPMIQEGSVTTISTGLRDEIGHELQEKLKREGYEEILKEDFTQTIGIDIENNAKVLLMGILKNLGWKDTKVEIYRKN